MVIKSIPSDCDDVSLCALAFQQKINHLDLFPSINHFDAAISDGFMPDGGLMVTYVVQKSVMDRSASDFRPRSCIYQWDGR